MRKVKIVNFGGSPLRGSICLAMDCASGLLSESDMDLDLYLFDKDVNSKTYTGSRLFGNLYQQLHEDAPGAFPVSLNRKEEAFEEILKRAGISGKDECILSMLSSGNKGMLNPAEQNILDICFTRDEQKKELEGGYYGKANIGSVTDEVLRCYNLYDETGVVTDIQNELDHGNQVDVVIVCSSFGGMGASLGINFGKYLSLRFQSSRSQLKLHAVHIQPYFSFPEPEEDDRWQIRCNEFYAKSADVIGAYAMEEDLICDTEQTEQMYVFDRYYYLGQAVLDQTTDINAPKDRQDNRLHLIDMLVSLAALHAVAGETEPGRQIYSHLFDSTGTEYLSWEQMPGGYRFKKRMVSFARFCAAVLLVLEPLMYLNEVDYSHEALVIHLYGRRKGFRPAAYVRKDVDEELRTVLKTAFQFCRLYLEYWQEIETTTRYGTKDQTVTGFFNQNEISRILDLNPAGFEKNRSELELDQLTGTKYYPNYQTGLTGLMINDGLLASAALKRIADQHTGRQMADRLLSELYKMCCVDQKFKQ
ncbi:MAG: hypothetical protein KHX84_01815 [Enterocloster asparagiformis]|nr:hypothetical protein [Enterocloster asparagiformis]